MPKPQTDPTSYEASAEATARRKLAAPRTRLALAAGGEDCKSCDHPTTADDEWNHQVRGELPMQRLDRSYAEILQEVRVAQTGVQCLLAFLLTLAFTPRFGMLSTGQLQLYVATLVLGAGATALLMAPAAFHRMVFRRRLKRHVVTAANRFALTGLAVLLAAKGCAILLILDVVLGRAPAIAVTAAVVTWFTVVWFVVPAWCRYRHRPSSRRKDVVAKDVPDDCRSETATAA